MCLCALSLTSARDLVRRSADSLYDNIYSAIAEYSSQDKDPLLDHKNLLEQQSVLPEQKRVSRQSSLQQQLAQLPRAGKMKKWERKKRRRRSLLRKLFLPFLTAFDDRDDDQRGSDSSHAPIHKNVVNPNNPFLRTKSTTTVFLPATTSPTRPHPVTRMPTRHFQPSEQLLVSPQINSATTTPKSFSEMLSTFTTAAAVGSSYAVPFASVISSRPPSSFPSVKPTFGPPNRPSSFSSVHPSSKSRPFLFSSDAEVFLPVLNALSPSLGRQRQVIVDGFPAGLPSGTPEGVRIALASAQSRKKASVWYVKQESRSNVAISCFSSRGRDAAYSWLVHYCCCAH